MKNVFVDTTCLDVLLDPNVPAAEIPETLTGQVRPGREFVYHITDPVLRDSLAKGMEQRAVFHKAATSRVLCGALMLLYHHLDGTTQEQAGDKAREVIDAFVLGDASQVEEEFARFEKMHLSSWPRAWPQPANESEDHHEH